MKRSSNLVRTSLRALTLGFATVVAGANAFADGYSTRIVYQGLERPTGILAGSRGGLYITQVPTPGINGQNGGRNTVDFLSLRSGRIRNLSTGEPAPTNLALDQRGNLYWTCKTAGVILRMDRRGDVVHFLDGLVSPSGIAAGRGGAVYFTQLPTPGVPGTAGGMNTVNVSDGIDIDVVSLGEPEPTDVAVSRGGDLYWTCKTAGVILRKAADGTVTKLLEGLRSPTGVAIDRMGRALYFTEVPTPGVPGSAGGQNLVSKLDLRTMELSVVHAGDPEPTDITVARDGVLYWTCSAAGVIMEARPDKRFGTGVGGAHITVTVENLAPDNGNYLTPMFVAFHDASFDVFDPGSSASASLERLAEDGATGPIAAAFAASGAGDVSGTIVGNGAIPPLAPGESGSMTFWVDASTPYFSYASMVIPSNDAFIGNDHPMGYPVFDQLGRFSQISFVEYGSDVWDAGTEVNDEVPANTAFLGQSAPNVGVTEGGNVVSHGGFLPAGSGGILDTGMFAGADFTVEGYQVARITITMADSDGDGVPDDRDQCPETPVGAAVGPGGCSVSQLVPCDGPWKNHRAYVRAVVGVVGEFWAHGLVTETEAQEIVAAAADSDCGIDGKKKSKSKDKSKSGKSK